MSDSLEHAEHVHHAAEHGNMHAALLVAVLAAVLAICEQQAKRAEITVQANAILATDSWNQYQAKSTRQVISDDLAAVLAAVDPPTDSAVAQKRASVVKKLQDDVVRFQKDPADGKEAIATRARHFEQIREEYLARSHSFDNASAALQLGIVLATASAITASKFLIRFAMMMGVAGFVLGVLAVTFPEIGAF